MSTIFPKVMERCGGFLQASGVLMVWVYLTIVSDGHLSGQALMSDMNPGLLFSTQNHPKVRVVCDLM